MITAVNEHLRVGKVAVNEESVRENARQKLQSERNKLNQNLIKSNSQHKQIIVAGAVRSSTNEGSKSVATFNQFKRPGLASENSLSSHDSFTSSSKDRRLSLG